MRWWRLWRIRRLAKNRDLSAAYGLMRFLRSKDTDIRVAAADAFATLGRRLPTSGEPKSALIAALNDPDARVRASSANALGSIALKRPASRDMVSPLVFALKDADPRVRSAAARALSTNGAPEAIAPLVEALQDNDASVRSGAAFAFSWLSRENDLPPEAIDALTAALQDEDAWVKNCAREAINKIRKKNKKNTYRMFIFLEGSGTDQLYADIANHVIDRFTEHTLREVPSCFSFELEWIAQTKAFFYAVLSRYGASETPALEEIQGVANGKCFYVYCHFDQKQ